MGVDADDQWDLISSQDLGSDEDEEDDACISVSHPGCASDSKGASLPISVSAATDPLAAEEQHGRAASVVSVTKDEELSHSCDSSTSSPASSAHSSQEAAGTAAAIAEAEWMRDHVELELRSVKLISKDSGGAMQLGVKGGPGERRVLPIHMGEPETQALIRHNASRGAAVSGRPMTHDLLASCIAACGGRVARIDISDFQRTMFVAVVHIVRPGASCGAEGGFDADTVELDARPSDAVNVAVRAGARLYARRHVVESMSRLEQ